MPRVTSIPGGAKQGRRTAYNTKSTGLQAKIPQNQDINKEAKKGAFRQDPHQFLDPPGGNHQQVWQLFDPEKTRFG
jgi:hypothetical protein